MPLTLRDRIIRELVYYRYTQHLDDSLSDTHIATLSERITEAIDDSREAVSMLRNKLTGLGLKEAKDIVDAWKLQAPLGPKPPEST